MARIIIFLLVGLNISNICGVTLMEKNAKHVDDTLRDNITFSIFNESKIEESAPAHNISKRGIPNFARMLNDAAPCLPMRYNGHGCWCGMGGEGTPVDGIDRCCMFHDTCYRSRPACQDGWKEYTSMYDWELDSKTKTVVCKGTDYDSCGYQLCQCDVLMIRCLMEHSCPVLKAVCPSSKGMGVVWNLFDSPGMWLFSFIAKQAG